MASLAGAQTVALSAMSPNGSMVYLGLDSAGNLYNSTTISTSIATQVPGTVSPMAMTAQSPQGAQVYLKTDVFGNLLINCQSGCTSGPTTTNATQLQGFNISTTPPVANNILQYVGGAWTPESVTSLGASSVAGVPIFLMI